jgi:hypothetical protein
MPINYSVCLQKNIEKEDYIVCVKNISKWNEAVEYADKEKQLIENSEKTKFISLIHSKSNKQCDTIGKAEVYKVFYKSEEIGRIFIKSEIIG